MTWDKVTPPPQSWGTITESPSNTTQASENSPSFSAIPEDSCTCPQISEVAYSGAEVSKNEPDCNSLDAIYTQNGHPIICEDEALIIVETEAWEQINELDQAWVAK